MRKGHRKEQKIAQKEKELQQKLKEKQRTLKKQNLWKIKLEKHMKESFHRLPILEYLLNLRILLKG